MITIVLKSLSKFAVALFSLCILQFSPAQAADQLSVGYLEERPAPMHFSRAKAVYDDAVPGGVSWRAFAGNDDMLLALMEGEVDVLYGQSPTAFARGISLGMEMHAIGIAMVQISDSVEFIVASDQLMNKRAEQLQAFMDVTEATNKQWRDTPDTMRPAIAASLELQQVQSDLALDASSYPLALEQRDDKWMENKAVAQLEQQAEALLSRGQIPEKADSYAVYVTLRFLR